MKSLCLTVARFALCAWIGAAALFVITSVREVRSPAFDSMDRDVLVAVRFPAYYAFGFTMIIIATVTGWLARHHHHVDSRRATGAVRLLILALVLMIIDYVKVYSPLLAMVTPPGTPRTPEFDRYHRWSEQINAIGLLLCAISAWRLLWPPRVAATTDK